MPGDNLRDALKRFDACHGTPQVRIMVLSDRKFGRCKQMDFNRAIWE